MCFLTFVEELASWQANRGRVVFIENPGGSLAWEQLPLERVRSNPRLTEGITHMCMHGKKHPVTEVPIRKATGVVATPKVVE